MSAKLTPEASTAILTWPGSGAGSGAFRSVNASLAEPCLVSESIFIGAAGPPMIQAHLRSGSRRPPPTEDRAPLHECEPRLHRQPPARAAPGTPPQDPGVASRGPDSCRSRPRFGAVHLRAGRVPARRGLAAA